jgi:hypothetical protein
VDQPSDRGKNMEYRISPLVVEYLLSGPNPSPGQTPEIRSLTKVSTFRWKMRMKGPLIRVGVILPERTVRVLEALWKAGAQSNMIQMGILPPERRQYERNPLRLVTAIGDPLPGGTQEAVTYFLFLAHGDGIAHPK